MTKDELLEMLLVERHLPVPPPPSEPEPVFEPDTPENQRRRLATLNREVAAAAPKRATKPIPPVRRIDPDAGPRMVQRRGVWVADRSAA